VYMLRFLTDWVETWEGERYDVFLEDDCKLIGSLVVAPPLVSETPT
jgi:hypothetical protein